MSRSEKIENSEGIAVSIKNVSKYYKLYKEPKDRFKEALSFTGKKYHERYYAVDNINLEIRKGEIIGIVGKNGSGKSTLLKLICKVLTPSSGEVKVNGEISALLELGSGLNPQFSGLDNIYFYGSVLGFTKGEMDEKVDDIVNFADIGEFIHQPIKTYSSGMKARLGFAVATHIEPDILILDEVLSVGDILFKRKSYAKMQEFFESGKTIIYVSHSSNEVNRLCGRAILLMDGKIIMDGKPKTVTRYYEKLLFSKKENQKKVKDEILNLVSEENKSINSDLALAGDKGGSALSPSVSGGRQDGSMLNKDDILQPYFIPNFESQNRVEYDNTHLEIFDICFKTLDGEQVNTLVINERYRYCYKLKFKSEFYDVAYSMQIHTEKGVVINSRGARQFTNKVIEHAFKGDEFLVEWEFNCLLHGGIYYTRIGVNTIENGKKVFINRISDATVFKVIQRKNNGGGLVSLQHSEPIIRRLTDDDINEKNSLL